MIEKPFTILGCLWIVLAVSACVTTGKRADVLDMYELPAVQRAQPYPGPIAVDNDAYYTQPGSYQPNPVYKGCAQINDSPSCGGG